MTTTDVAGVLEHMRDLGLGRQTVSHVRFYLRAIFDDLWRDGQVEANPVERVRMPRIATDKRRRAVLTEAELVAYLAWTHPDDNHRLGVLQRQTMAVVSWCFGGLRTGELHAMRWEHFDAPTFTRGLVHRRKTKDYQTIAVPEPMRPFLLRWWDEWGRPGEGLVFPVLRGDKAGKAAKRGVSHAKALRRDLRRALGLEAWDGKRWAATDATVTHRHRELFEATETTKPVDFHSFRRAAAGALATAGVNEQTAMQVLNHSDPRTHARYWSQAVVEVVVPEAALPALPSPRVVVSAPVSAEKAAALPFGKSRSEKRERSRHARRDSNPRPSDSKSDALSS